MLKKTILLAATTIIFSSSIIASTSLKPFIGVSYSYKEIQQDPSGSVGLDYTGNFYPSSYNGLGFLSGLKFGKYYAVAWGLNHYFNASRTVVYNTDPLTHTSVMARSENAYFDLRGYYPFYKNFDLIGFTTKYTTSTNQLVGYSMMDLNLRLGAGLDYFFTPHWGIEAMWNYVFEHAPVKYHLGPQTFALAVNFWSLNIGVNYLFG